jgi:hypothetical protein
MRKSGIFYGVVVALMLGFISFTACKKKNTEEVDGEQQSVVDNSVAEQEFMQVQPNVNNLAINTKGTSVKKGTATCDTLKFLGGDSTYTNASQPPMWEYDYSLNCPSAILDGVTRSGKVLITYMGKPKTAGSKTILKLLNYKVNAISYSCDSIVVTTNTVTPTTYQYKVQVINGKCTGATGWTIKFNCNKDITINLNNPGGADDVIIITGTTDGVNRLGRGFHSVSNQLTKHADCKWISAGTLELTPDGFKTRTVNYGDNDVCDDKATFTVNGQTVSFTLVK